MNYKKEKKKYNKLRKEKGRYAYADMLYQVYKLEVRWIPSEDKITQY